MIDQWRVVRTETLPRGDRLETLRQREGEGAHRLHIAGRVLFVGPDGATTMRKRRSAILAAYAQGTPLLSDILRSLKAVGAFWFELDGTRIDKPSRQQAKILSALVLRPQTGPDLNRIAHRFGARINELRNLGYPIDTQPIITTGPLAGQYVYTLGGTE